MNNCLQIYILHSTIRHETRVSLKPTEKKHKFASKMQSNVYTFNRYLRGHMNVCFISKHKRLTTASR